MSKKQYEMSFRLNGNIDPRLTRSFDDLSRDVTGLDKELGQLRKAKTFDKITQDATEAKGAFHDLREDAKEFGEVFERTLQFTGAHAIITKVGDMFSNMVSEVGALDDSVHQMGAATGATVDEMAGFRDITQEIYKNNFGEGFNDIANALVRVRQVTGQAGDVLEATTKNALIYRDVFGEDIPESIKAVDTMMKNFGITSEESFNLLAQGAQKGLNKSGELLDTANEYAPLFAKLGFSADGMFDTFSAGLEAGAFNLDKVGDGIKEFGIRSKDGSKQSLEAYKAIGLNGEQMTAQFAAGGDMAQKAFLKTVKAINSVQDPVKRNTAAVQLFGTQAEDLEDRVIKAYGNVQKQFDMTTSTMKQIEDVRYSSVTQDLQKLGRELMDSVVIPIGEDLMPVLQNLTAWATENKDVIKTLALVIPAGMITKNAVSMGRDLTRVSKSFFTVTDGASKFGTAVGMLTNPFGLAVGAVGALTLGVIAYKRHQEKARLELINMGDELKDLNKKYNDAAKNSEVVNDLVWEYQQLNNAVKNNSDSAENLVGKKQRLVDVTNELQELYPGIITQYEIENGLVADKVGLLKEEADGERELAKLRLEKKVDDGIGQLPKLEKDIGSLQDETDLLRAQKDAIQETKAAFKGYEAEYQRILKLAESAEKTAKLDDLFQRVSVSGQAMGYQFTDVSQLIDLPGTVEELEGQLSPIIDKLVTKSEELQASKATYQDLYDSQKKLIELDLGGKLEDYVKKYDTLSSEGKKSTDIAIQGMSDLYTQMDLIPAEKKINIITMYQEIGKIPTLTDINPMMANAPMKQYADGGIANRPSIFGEAGPEIAIPLNNKPRSQGLLDTANRLMGREAGALEQGRSATFAPVYSPKIIIQGNADARVVRESLQDSQREWEQNMTTWQRQQARRSLA